jgi:hypothetical protein
MPDDESNIGLIVAGTVAGVVVLAVVAAIVLAKGVDPDDDEWLPALQVTVARLTRSWD